MDRTPATGDRPDPPRPFDSPPGGWVACFEALDRAEAAAIAGALREAGVAAEPASIESARVVVVPPGERARALGWLRDQGLADRPRLQAERVRGLEGAALRGVLAFALAAIVGPVLAFAYGGPVSLLAWVVPLGIYWAAREWRRDREGPGPDR